MPYINKLFFYSHGSTWDTFIKKKFLPNIKFFLYEYMDQPRAVL